MAKIPTKDLRAIGLPATGDYQHYSHALHRYLRRRIQHPEDIADLTQDIFELFVRRKDRDEVIRDPLAYLFRIAFHVVGASIADERRNPVVFDSQLLDKEIAGNKLGSSDEDAQDLVIQEHVKAALLKLPKNHLAALLLVEGEGLSYKEAARRSGFAPTTIASYVMHARAALKLELDKDRTR